MTTPRRTRRTRRLNPCLLEALEPRQYLTGLGGLSPIAQLMAAQPRPTFVLDDASVTLVGTLKNSRFTIPEDTVTSGPALQTVINWGDGTSSEALLHRDGSGRIEIWAGHAYSAVKNYGFKVLATVGSSPSRVALSGTARVVLNAARGRTINLTAGRQQTSILGTSDRTSGLPVLATPQSAIALLPGARFAQFTLGATGATATFRIDWGDGQVSDGQAVSNAQGNYDVLGTHTYAATGSYRIVTNIVIASADNTVLHVDMIDSTAHVAASGARPPRFTLPQRAPLTWADVLPPSATLAGADHGATGGLAGSGSVTLGTLGGALGSSGGALGGVLTIGGATTLTGGATTFTAGSLNLGGGGLVTGGGSGLIGIHPITLPGGGSLQVGSGSATLNLSGGSVTITLGNGSGVIAGGSGGSGGVVLTNGTNSSLGGVIGTGGSTHITLSGPLTVTSALPLPATIVFANTGTLKFVLDPSRTAQLAFSSTVDPSLFAATLDLEIAPAADPAALVGRSFQIFTWPTPPAAGSQFHAIITDPRITWDLSNLYTTGTVAITGLAPQP